MTIVRDHPLHCIVPPYVLESIARHGTPQQRSHARATLTAIARVHATRGPRTSRPTRSTATAPLVPTKHREIYSSKHTDDLPGTLVRGEGDDPVSDPDANRVFDGFGATWDLYSEVYGRNSYDGHGASLIGSVHYLNHYDNAFWSDDDGQMAFGDGDGRLFNSFTVSVDVMGHELTHAVTSRTSGLVYVDQSGALNEHVSDVFGSLVKQRLAGQTADQADWLIGQGLLAAGVNGVALRSMKAPGTAFDDPVLGHDPQPATMADFVHTTSDHGGVHTNSGIPNKAFFLFATALGGNAWERAGMVWFATCTDGTLPSDASFQTFANRTTDHAYELLGHDGADACATAWAGVGISVPHVRHVDHTLGTARVPSVAGQTSGYDYVSPTGEEDPDVVYRGTDRHVYGAWTAMRAGVRGLGHDDLSTLAGTPGAAFDPVGYAAGGQQRTAYVDESMTLHILGWDLGAVGHSQPLDRVVTGVPAAFTGADGEEHVLVNGHFGGTWWVHGRFPSYDSEFLSDGAPTFVKPVEDPTAYFSSDGLGNLIRRHGDGHLWQTWWTHGASDAGSGDLTVVSGGSPTAVGQPAAYFQESDASHHVIYRGEDGHLHEMWWQGPDAPGQGDLTQEAGAPPSTDDPFAYFMAVDATHHVIYRTSDGHLHEMWWQGPSAPGDGDLMAVSDAPPAAPGRPSGYLSDGGRVQHVVYRGTDGHLHELSWR